MPVQGLSDAGVKEWNDELNANAEYREEVKMKEMRCGCSMVAWALFASLVGGVFSTSADDAIAPP
jgi:hypothetical protein